MLSPQQYAERISGLTAAEVVVVAGDQPLATTQPDADPDELPDRGPVTVAGVDYRASSFKALAVGGPIEVSLLMPNRETASPDVARVAGGPDRVPRLPRARVRLRRRGQPAAAVRDPAAAGGRAAARQRGLLGRGARRGQRRVRRARQGVQLDGAPARGAAGGAPARARAPAGGDPPGRRVVLGQPRPRRAAGDRGADRGRRHRRRLRPRDDARRRRRAAAGGGARRRAGGVRPRAARRRGGGDRRRPGRGDPDRRRERARRAARRQRGGRPGGRHRVGRPRRPRVHPRRARAVRVPHQPGVGVGRERRPARDGRSARR